MTSSLTPHPHHCPLLQVPLLPPPLHIISLKPPVPDRWSLGWLALPMLPCLGPIQLPCGELLAPLQPQAPSLAGISWTTSHAAEVAGDREGPGRQGKGKEAQGDRTTGWTYLELPRRHCRWGQAGAHGPRGQAERWARSRLSPCWTPGWTPHWNSRWERVGEPQPVPPGGSVQRHKMSRCPAAGTAT